MTEIEKTANEAAMSEVSADDMKTAYAETIRKNADRLCELRRRIESLKSEAAELEGYFLKLAEADLTDTKYKSVKYRGTDGNSVTATTATSVKILYPGILKMILGKAFDDAVKQEITYKISTAAASRMIAGIYTGDYETSEPEEVLRSITDDERELAVLRKKLRGASFDTDKKNLMAALNLKEKDAEEYAYLYSEAVCWQNFKKLLESAGYAGSPQKAIESISAAVAVTETPKIKTEV